MGTLGCHAKIANRCYRGCYSDGAGMRSNDLIGLAFSRAGVSPPLSATHTEEGSPFSLIRANRP